MHVCRLSVAPGRGIALLLPSPFWCTGGSQFTSAIVSIFLITSLNFAATAGKCILYEAVRLACLAASSLAAMA